VLNRHDRDPSEFFLQAPVAQQSVGNAGSFIGLGSDGQRWRVKVPDNPQTPKTLVSDLIVGKLGPLIGAPVCEVAVIWIGEECAGWEYRPGSTLRASWAFASLEVPGVTDSGELTHRGHGDNARRHVGVLALYDWCLGHDPHWLYQGTADYDVYSHDHGFYLLRGNLDRVLATPVDQPHPLPNVDGKGLDGARLADCCAVLRAMTLGPLSAAVSLVPTTWPATDGELEDLARFLLARAPSVADRLNSLRVQQPGC
jgi:hypothetical protein